MNEFMQHVIWAFLNSIWQSALLAALAFAGLRLLPRSTAALRFAVWSAVLAAAAVLPIINASLPAKVLHVAAAPAPITYRLTERPTHITPALPPVRFVAPLSTRSAPLRPAVISPVRAPSVAQWLAAQAADAIVIVNSWVDAHATAIVMVWAALSLAFIGRLMIGLGSLTAIKRALVPIVDSRTARLEERAPRGVMVGASDIVESPCVIGYARPAIALPAAFVRDLDGSDLDKILAHEFAHVRRFDDWSNLLAQLARAIWFANPFVHVVSRRLDIEREIACDDLVAEGRNDRLEYAKCLTEIARRSTFARHLAPAAGFFPDRKQIVVRIEQLLDANHIASARLGAIPVVGAVALIVAVILLARFQVPAFARTQPAPAAVTTSISAPSAMPVAAPAPAASAAPAVAPAADAPVASPVPAVSRVHPRVAPKVRTKVKVEVKVRMLNRTAPMPFVLQVRAEDMARLATRLRSMDKVRVFEAYGASMQQELQAQTAWRTAVRAAGRVDGTTPYVVFGSRDSTDSFLDALSEAGYHNLSIDDLIKVRNAGVSAEYLRSLKQYGITPMPLDDLISLANAGVSARYLADISKLGYTKLGVKSLIALANSGVDPGYIKALSDAGYAGVSTDDLIRLANAGVSASLVRSLKAHGYFANGRPSVDDLIKLATAGF